ncbi:hypothetical protein HKX48_009019 [Thoreauomyces humboldtii]|nr:hypothetical protein HKX48_009019 [Thoreauomyces humboldtii]
MARNTARSAVRPKLCPSPIHLDAKLILRRAAKEDRDKVVAFVTEIFGGWQGPDNPPARAAFANFASNYFDHVAGAHHPTADWESWTVVMDGDRLASCMASIPQTWTYGDGVDPNSPRVAFTVLRPELVGSDPAYRDKGLIRHQFAVHQAWCTALESPMQIIRGLRSYYRQFGYGYGLAHAGGRFGNVGSAPPASALAGYMCRRATREDVDFLTTTQRHAALRHALAYDWGHDEWMYALEGTYQPHHYYIAEKDGKRVAFFKLDSRWMTKGEAAENDKGTSPDVKRIEIAEGQAWTVVVPAILRWLAERAASELATAISTDSIFQGETECLDPLVVLPANWKYRFECGPQHPAFDVCAKYLPNISEGYAKYTRISLPLLLPTIIPVLEHRLARSPFAFHTGSLTLLNRDRGDAGCVLTFTNGVLTYRAGDAPGDVRFKDRAARGEDVVLFPSTTIVGIVTGYHGVQQVLEMFPDAGACGRGRVLMEVLFPKRDSVGDSAMV